ncbi:MAG: hypothetical protein ACETWM_21265 [Candidatus Lokiarchaeia archaeon]
MSFSQYLLTQDKVKLLKGNHVLAEEDVFQLLPRIRDENFELPSYENFLAFNEESDEKLEFAYEVNVCGKKVSSCFYIFTKQPLTQEVLDAKVQSILSAFNLNTECMRASFDVLEDVFLGMIGGEYFSRIRKVKGESNILLLEAGGRVTYVAVIALKGSPDYESLHPECMDFFVKSIQNLDGDVSLVIPFRFVKVGESENMLKKDLRVRILVNGKIPVKYFEVSPYLVVRGPSLESVKNHMKRVSVAVSAAWSGIKKRISVEFFDSDETKKLLHHIICRRLLPEREVFRIKNLSMFLRIPSQVVKKETKSPMVISDKRLKANNYNNNRVLLGKTALGGRLVPVWMDYDDFSKYVVIFGESPQKNYFMSSLLNKISKPWIVLDFKGEFCKLKGLCKDTVSFFAPNSDSEPLRINLFDSKEKSPDEHASFLLGVFKKIFEGDLDIVEESLHKILSHFSNKIRYKQGLKELNKAFDEILTMNDSQKQSAVSELAAMFHSLQHGVLDKVFSSGDSNLDLTKLTNERAVIDLTRIISKADNSELKFFLTYILMYLFSNLPKGRSGVKHITVINSPENNSDLINFLTKVVFDKSALQNIGEGLILFASEPQGLSGIDVLDSCYKILFNGVRRVKKTAEILGINPDKIESLGEKALMIIPETEKQVTFYPYYDKSLFTDEASGSQVREDHTTRLFKTLVPSRKNNEEIRDHGSENPLPLMNGDFVTADALLKGYRNSNKISFDSPYNFSREQIEALVDKISHMLESEVYLTDIYISKLTGIPYKTVNKIMRGALDTDSGIQRIYVPVVGDKANIPLYYSKYGPKYESVQDKYLKDILEELCFKTGINWSIKRDLETGADGKIESHSLKLIVHIPEDDELKNIFQKLFLKFNQVAVLFLHDKDLEKAEELNSQWRIPLIMGCLSNLNAFLTEIRMASTEKIPSQSYAMEKDLQELISWLEADT